MEEYTLDLAKTETREQPGANIPVLNERFENTREINKNNPFLPYATLEKLAVEREEFKKQLAEFEHHFAEQDTNGNTPNPAPQKFYKTATKTDSISELIQQTTTNVLAEYAAEIEMEVYRRVKTKLFGNNNNQND